MHRKVTVDVLQHPWRSLARPRGGLGTVRRVIDTRQRERCKK